MTFYVYFLRSLKNKKIYVGFTNKLPELRLKEHNAGRNAWTKQNRPLKLLYYESYFCKKDARAREKFYKTGFGRKIRNIILDNLDG